MAQPVMVTSFTDYQRQFGGFRTDSFLTYAAQAFFLNGGQRLYIVRVAVTAVSSPPGSPPAQPAQLATSPGSFPLRVSAINERLWGNSLSLAIRPSANPDANNFKLIVYYDPGTGPAVVETYDPVTHPGSPTLLTTATNPAQDVLAAVNSSSEYIAITAPLTSMPPNTVTNSGQTTTVA
jgi:hypothetical protein